MNNDKPDANGYWPGEADMVLRRMMTAVQANPVGLEDVLKAAEFIAHCTRYGLNVTDVLLYGIRQYPHIMADMGEVWDTKPFGGELEETL